MKNTTRPETPDIFSEITSLFQLPWEGALALIRLFQGKHDLVFKQHHPHRWRTSICLKTVGGILCVGAIAGAALGSWIALPVLYINLSAIGAFSKLENQKLPLQAWGKLALQLSICLAITTLIFCLPGIREILLFTLLGVSLLALTGLIKHPKIANWSPSFLKPSSSHAEETSDSNTLTHQKTLLFQAKESEKVIDSNQNSSTHCPRFRRLGI